MSNAAPPKLRRPAYHVWLDPRPDLTPDSPELPESELVYEHVIVNHADQLRAELEANRHGLSKPQDTPMHLSSLWLWAALVRTKRYDDKYAAFKLACIAWDADKETDGPDVQPDPTEASTN